MKDKKVQAGLCVVAVFTLLFLLIASKSWGKNTSNNRYNVGTRTYTITITADKPSDVITLVGPRGESLGITPRIMDDETAYYIIYNGGKTNGGFEEHIPARNKRPPGWKSGNPGENKAISAQFCLEPSFKKADISCTIYLKDG